MSIEKIVLQKKLAKDYKMSTNANFFLVSKTPTGMDYFLQANLDNSVFNLDAPLKSENFYSESN